MAKLGRYTQKVFATNAGANQLAEIGSYATASPVAYSGATVNPDLVQALSNFTTGWNAIVAGGNSPAIEDMNALCYLFAFQIAYLMQEGVAEWDPGTTYYIGSIAQDGNGNLYVSKIDDNLNNALSNQGAWLAKTSTGPALGNIATRQWVWEDAPLASGVPTLWQGVCWSEELQLFAGVAAGASGTQVMTSPDGFTWTIRTTGTNRHYTSICWSPSVGLFVAVNQDTGITAGVITSPDGITWTARVTPNIAANGAWQAVCWSPDLNLFVAVGATNDSTHAVMSSTNGTTWTLHVTPSSTVTYQSVCWSPELGIFLAVGQAGNQTDAVLKSNDGITWTKSGGIGGATASWLSVCWSPQLSLFVAVGGDTPTAVIMYSSDGISWANGMPPNGVIGSELWRGIAWSADLNLFAAVDDTNGEIMTSIDGHSWILRKPPTGTAGEFTAICYSPLLSLFVAVSENNSDQNQVAISK